MPKPGTMHRLVIFVFLATATLCLAQDGKPIFVPKPWLETVKKLDTPKYLGRWYQMYGNRFGWLQYADAVCNVADYKQLNETTISVRNTGTLGTVDGKKTEIRGWAIRTNIPGRYRLRLGNVAFEGSYWVLKLGPVLNGKYEYSIVSSQGGATLYVLSRDIHGFKKYEQEILDFLKVQRFTDYLSEPIPIFQNDSCRRVPEEDPGLAFFLH